jgi:hypothetical protein
VEAATPYGVGDCAALAERIETFTDRRALSTGRWSASSTAGSARR